MSQFILGCRGVFFEDLTDKYTKIVSKKKGEQAMFA